MRASSRSDDDVDTVAIFKRADFEWEKGQKKKALALFLQAALLGNPSAQHNVGYFYDVGVGTKPDSKKALYWYKKAWRGNGQTDSCINIAHLYASRKNSRNAVLWWYKAIKQGDGDAALDLAKFYLGKGGKRNKAKALALLRKVGATRHVLEDSVKEAARILKAEKASI